MTEHSPQSTETSTSSAEHIETEDAFDQLITENQRVLVDFYADWCGPCQLMAPRVDELAAECEATIVKIDVETLPGVASRYDIRSIPTFLAFRSGSVEEQFVGMQEKETLKQAIEEI